MTLPVSYQRTVDELKYDYDTIGYTEQDLMFYKHCLKGKPSEVELDDSATAEINNETSAPNGEPK